MVDPQLAEACRLQAEQAELGPALTLLQHRGKLGAPLLALAQAVGIAQNQLQKPVEPTSVSHARALVQRLVEVGVQTRQQGLEPAIYFEPQPRSSSRPPGKPRPPAAAQDRSPYLRPPAPVYSPKPPAPAPPPPSYIPPPRAPTPPPKPQLNLSISFSVERDRAGQVAVTNVRLSGPDGANYKILAQPQDEVSSTEGLLRSLGIIVELERR